MAENEEEAAPEYQPPDIVWEEEIPKVVYGVTCGHKQGQGGNCRTVPNN